MMISNPLCTAMRTNLARSAVAIADKVSSRAVSFPVSFPNTIRWMSSDQSMVERPRRSLLSVPGADMRKIEKAAGLNVDTIVLDLEDGVAIEHKAEARRLVVEALQNQQRSDGTFFGSSEVCVRINALDTGRLALDDLHAILPFACLQGIVMPKVEYASDIDFVRRLISMSNTSSSPETPFVRMPGDVRILAAIESARGLLNLEEIAQAGFGNIESSLQPSNKVVDALIFASEDYCADLELIRTTNATEMLYARSKLVTTAKAYGIQAIDMVHIDFRNLPDLERECQEGRRMGFTGKQAIHPAQLETIHKTFVPSSEDIVFAGKCVEEYETATKSNGKGACVVDGIVVDAPVYKWANKILKRAELAKLL